MEAQFVTKKENAVVVAFSKFSVVVFPMTILANYLFILTCAFLFSENYLYNNNYYYCRHSLGYERTFVPTRNSSKTFLNCRCMDGEPFWVWWTWGERNQSFEAVRSAKLKKSTEERKNVIS